MRRSDPRPAPDELVATRAALEADYQRYRDLFDFAPDGYLVTDTSGTIRECNHRASTLLGTRQDLAVGKPLAEFVEEQDLGLLAGLFRRLEGTEEETSQELRLHPRGARTFPATVDVARATDAAGRVTGLRWLIRDRSERKRMEQDLRDDQDLLRTVIETAVDGIILLDHTGSIVSFNLAAERMFGYEAAEVLGRNVDLLMPPSWRGAHNEHLRRYLETGETRIIGRGLHVEGLRRDGSVFPMDLSVSEIRRGERHVFAGIMRDVSQRKRLEGELLQAQKMEAVGRLAGGIAHDFNNLLMGLLGCCRIAEKSMADADRSVTAPVHQQIEEIQAAVERGVNLTRQLLDFSRRRSRKPVAMSLDEAVTAAGRMLPNLLGDDVTFRTSLEPSGAYVLADPGQIDQVLVNLAINARDAMWDGGVLSIEVRAVDPLRDAEQLPRALQRVPHIRLSVTDTGSGMTPETKERLFEPFFTTKAQGEGTGLGLSTVYGIVMHFGGHIEVESEVGVGTTFRIYFPRIDAPIADFGEVEERGAAPPERRPGKTVLVVEDERLVRAAVRCLLGDLGHEVLVADGPSEAHRLAEERRGDIDLLLTDVQMPQKSGPELARELVEANPDLAVVFMSAFSREVLIEEGRIDRDALTLEKPFEERELAAVVDQALSRPKES